MKTKTLACVMLASLTWGCTDDRARDTAVQDYGIAESSVLIVAHGEAITFNGSDLVLHGVDPLLSWFTDRPAHRVGKIKAARLEGFWSYGKDSFAENPPNAAVVVDGRAPVIVEFTGVTVADASLTFPTLILDGEIPQTGGPTTLVIDSTPIPDCCFDPQNIECPDLGDLCDQDP